MGGGWGWVGAGTAAATELQKRHWWMERANNEGKRGCWGGHSGQRVMGKKKGR